MPHLNRLVYTTLLLAFFSVSHAQTTGTIEFVENKGQWDNQVRFMGQIPAGAFFIRNQGFTVVQYNVQDYEKLTERMHGHSEEMVNGRRPSLDDPLKLRGHAYHVNFTGTSKTARIVPDKALSSYNNYILGNDPSKWASECRIYQGVTIEGLYPGVDMRYYTQNGFLKYDLIVKPGADISRIAMKYEGADKLEVKNKELVISTSVGLNKELEPFTYQYVNGARNRVNAKFVLKGDEVRFDIRNYDRNKTLVIDPTRIFCSFSGSTASNWGFTATYDAGGFFYGGGIAFNTGFPVSPGAFDVTWGGGTGNQPTDMAIIKLSPNGANRVFATYIGGDGNDQPHSLIVDAAGNLVLAGRSNSANYPVTGGNNGIIGTGGGYDIVVTKLNAAGSGLIGSKRVGGTGEDGVNISSTRALNLLQQNYGDDGRSEVILDGAGFIYVASMTRSMGAADPADNFPASAGVFQPVGGGGNQDGVVIKFDANINNLQFASYLGGSDVDACYVLALGPGGNIYVGGGTRSIESSFPGNKAGTIHPTFQGNIDGFVAVISNDGSTILRSTYLGTSAIDQVYGIQFDNMGFPYVMGQTGGNWPITPNVGYSVAGAPQFIAKLEPDLSAFVYSTRFGKSSSTPNISPIAFLVDNCENVYVSGWGGQVGFGGFQSSGTINMPTTPDAFKSQGDPVGDFYFFVLQKNAAAMLYGSFYGQQGGAFPDHVDGGTSRFDRQGVIYQAMCANCGGGPFPTSPGVWGPNNLATGAGNGDCNLAMLKMAFNFAGVDAGPQSSINGVVRDTAGCVPLTVDFVDTVANAQTYFWNFGDGSPELTTTVPSTSHTYNAVGLYRVRLIVEDSNTCNIRDTAYLNIRVGDLQAALDFNPVKLDPCDSLKYRFDNLSVAPGALPFSSKAFRWDFGDGTVIDSVGLGPVFHSYANSGTYIIKLILLDTGYCNAPDSAVKGISIAPNVVADFTTPATGCVPYLASFTNTSIAGQSFEWDFGDGGTSVLPSPTHLYTAAGTYTIRLIAIDPNTCNVRDTIFKTITVFDNPVSNFSTSPVPPTVNTPTTFVNLASADAVNFKWLFGDGDSLVTNSRLAVLHQYVATGTYTACLIAINSNGCADTLCAPVEAIVEAQVDVPNAFTPNSNDVNSKIFVRGFGIVKMKFTIYNRWGQKVFESNALNNGWDGRFKGVLQPMDVYGYTLEVEFFDGTRASRKGDITLIR